MTLELDMLALSVVLGLVQIVLASHTASLQRGYLWTAGSRDEAAPPLTGVAGRLERARDNFVETFPLFAATVLAAHVVGIHSWMTEWGVQLYFFWARVAYVAFYAGGLFLVRSLVGRRNARDRLDPPLTNLKHGSRDTGSLGPQREPTSVRCASRHGRITNTPVAEISRLES